MTKTPYLGLNVTREGAPDPDADVLFRHFRRQIAGDIPESNMRILDEALHRISNQIAQLRSISSGGARFYVQVFEQGEGVLQIVPDNVIPSGSQIRISDIGIEGIQVGDLVMLVVLDPDGMAELLDIRNAVTGVVHASAGDALRAVEQAVIDLENGVNLNGTRGRQVIHHYTNGEVTLQPGLRYFLSDIPAALTIVLDDTRAAPDVSQEFTFVLLEQETAYGVEVEYFSGAGISWQQRPVFRHRSTHVVKVFDGIASVMGAGGGGGAGDGNMTRRVLEAGNLPHELFRFLPQVVAMACLLLVHLHEILPEDIPRQSGLDALNAFARKVPLLACGVNHHVAMRMM